MGILGDYIILWGIADLLVINATVYGLAVVIIIPQSTGHWNTTLQETGGSILGESRRVSSGLLLANK